jgi:CheY-like chemotaxis protein
LGIGLFLVRSIVEAHGGVVVANSPGTSQGATFTVTLPKVIAESPQPSSALSPSAPELNLDGIGILLVDDDRTTSRIISFSLERFGANVTTVQSAAEARETLSQGLPDLLVSDIGLPDMNGYELIQRIRALPPARGGELVAIAVSGYTDPQSVTMALTAGFQAHLGKPVNINELVNQISDLIQS